jgi:glucokinase
VYLVNDFEVIGFGLNLIDPKDIVTVKNGLPRPNANKAIIGAGTGLGKCIMFYDRFQGTYDPVASEGGHADFAVQTQEELDLILFIQKCEGWSCHVSWEDVLSGNGIKRIYAFYSQKNGGSDHPISYKNGPHPDQIFARRFDDEHCWNTYQMYGRLYARCAKNFALDALSLSGMYIAGGIAAHNVELFKEPAFYKEFINCGKQQELLKEIPIYVIGDYNVSLYGAAAYLLIQGVC